MFPHHSDQMSQRSQVSRVALCMPKGKVPGSWRLSVGSWRVSVGSWRLSGVPSLYLTGSWRLYVGSWRSSVVPGSYLAQGVLLSCSGQLKTLH